MDCTYYRQLNVVQFEHRPLLSERLSEVSSKEDEDGNSEEWFESRGYAMETGRPANLISLEGFSTVTSSNENLERTNPYLTSPADPGYDVILEQHNIAIIPYNDPIIDKLRKLILADDSERSGIDPIMSQEREESEETNWQVDRFNCARSNEARFQRTMLIEMVDRFRLDIKIDFTCEATWYSHRFPCRDCSPKQCKISNPTPDLSFALRSETLLMNDEFSIAWTRLKSLGGHIFPEGTKQY